MARLKDKVIIITGAAQAWAKLMRVYVWQKVPKWS